MLTTYSKCSSITIMKKEETKAATFKRLATNRTNNAIKNVRLLGNLSNKHNYFYTENDFRLIFNMIEDEVKLAKSRFLIGLSKKNKLKF